jgi:hypothetical protein
LSGKPTNSGLSLNRHIFNLRGELAGYSLDIRNSDRLGMLPLEQFALGFSERLFKEMTSGMI